MARDSFFSAAMKGNDKPKTEKSRLQAPVVGLIDGVGDSLSEENERLRSQISTGSVLVELDPNAIVEGLISDRASAREDDPSFLDLKSSIEARGQDQAIVVRPTRAGEGYELIAGRRRLRACQDLGRKVIARVQNLDDRSALAVMWSENNLRLNPSPLELAAWMVAVRDQFKMGTKDLREITGFGGSYISELTKIGDGFPDEIRSILVDARKVSKAKALDVVTLMIDKKSREVVRKNLEKIKRLSTTDKQISAILKAAVVPASLKGQPEKRVILSSNGDRKGTITFTGKGARIDLASGLTSEQIGKIEELLRDL